MLYVSCFGLSEIHVDGTGHKIAMTISVENQLIAAALPAIQKSYRLSARFCSQINFLIPFSIMGNTTSCYGFGQN